MTHTLKIPVLIMFLGAASLNSCSQQDSHQSAESTRTIVGTWIKIVGSAQKVTLSLKSENRYELDFTGDFQADVWGKYTVSEGRVIFVDTGGEYDCSDVEGFYEYNSGEYQLTFSLIQDECKGRAHVILGLWVVEDYQQAIEEYTRAIEANASDVDAYFNRGGLRRATQDYMGALNDYGKVLELDSDHAGAYAGRGSIKGIYLLDYPGSLSDYDRALELDPQLEMAYFNRGLVKNYLGDKEGACADWKKSSELGFLPAKELIENECQGNTRTEEPQEQNR